MLAEEVRIMKQVGFHFSTCFSDLLTESGFTVSIPGREQLWGS